MLGLSKYRQAFTIVELLVVISIIGLLIGMLLPAVQNAREAGRRSECVNNVKQLGLAMLHYESKFNYFPNCQGTTGDTGYTAGNPNSVDGFSWIAKILPYIEEDVIYNKIKFDKGLGYSDPQYDNLRAAQQVISPLICPSDSGYGKTLYSVMYPTFAVGSTNYKACAGTNWQHSVDPVSLVFDLNIPPKNRIQPAPPPWPRPLTDRTYPGREKVRNALPLNMSDDGRDNGNGIMCRNNLPIDPANPTKRLPPIITSTIDIRDGQSHTFAIGEAVVSSCNFNSWYWFNGTTATCALPLSFNYKNNTGVPNPTPPDMWENHWEYTYGFSSRHAVGANFCMCDGSVKFIANNIDMFVYQVQATISGGELVNEE
jgi:prepilin-type N-terminal cleavage/methylation domain-containing protein/prepilin-type processing-associated H-X9-DG protein